MRSASGVESLENHTWGGMRNRLLKIQTFITRHYIILTSSLYRVQTLTSHETEESENCLESPHLGEIKCIHKQCVPGAPSFFVRARDYGENSYELKSGNEATSDLATLHVS